MVFKCKICGGQTVLDAQSGIATCEYCGTKQALPLFSADSERLLYESGNNYLLHSEYDKAENVFNQLLTINPNAAELYWDLVLCKYGVTYVKDPATDKYIPTCNRTHYTPIFSDANYLKAVELSSGEKKALFEEDAKTIDDIQRGIIAVSKKEKPFDIFISYKETDANGNRTKDSVEAQKLYEKLTEAGYKVFFSRITLEDKIGSEYEPYIYAALYSSKVMITLCSSKEHIEAVWVKNEWGRFLALQQQNAEKNIIPLYFDMERTDLPDEFSLIPSFDIKELGFEDELLRSIKKQIPLPIMLAQKRKAMKKTLTISALSFLGVAVICCAIFLPGAIKNKIYGGTYNEAMALFDNQEYAEAKPIFESISTYKDAKYMIERCDRQPDYDAAMQLYNNGEYAQAAWAFRDMGDYEDAADMQKKAESSWRKSLATPVSGGYVVTETGTILPIKGSEGSAHTKVDITKNGKVISIARNNMYSAFATYATVLHENGTVSQPEIDAELSQNPEWHDMIKISTSFRSCMIGLRNDGKIVLATENSLPEYIDEPQQLQEVLEWTDIIDFQHNIFPGNGNYVGYIVGLKSDGSLCIAQLFEHESMAPTYPASKIVQGFKNVERFAISGYSTSDFSLIALTKDGKLITYYDGKTTEKDGVGICDVLSPSLVLKDNGDLVDLGYDKVLLRDVVYGERDYAITRSGQVWQMYTYKGSTTITPTENTSPIYEEWTARLK